MAGITKIPDVSGIKSIQRGSASLAKAASTDVTINAVALDKTIVIVSQKNGYGGSSGAQSSTSIGARLTTTTNLALSNGTSRYGSEDGNATIYYEVVEYY